jgi:hypothetical protein
MRLEETEYLLSKHADGSIEELMTEFRSRVASGPNGLRNHRRRPARAGCLSLFPVSKSGENGSGNAMTGSGPSPFHSATASHDPVRQPA